MNKVETNNDIFFGIINVAYYALALYVGLNLL